MTSIGSAKATAKTAAGGRGTSQEGGATTDLWIEGSRDRSNFGDKVNGKVGARTNCGIASGVGGMISSGCGTAGLSSSADEVAASKDIRSLRAIALSQLKDTTDAALAQVKENAEDGVNEITYHKLEMAVHEEALKELFEDHDKDSSDN